MLSVRTKQVFELLQVSNRKLRRKQIRYGSLAFAEKQPPSVHLRLSGGLTASRQSNWKKCVHPLSRVSKQRHEVSFSGSQIELGGTI